MGTDRVYDQLTTDLQKKIFQKIVTSEVGGPNNTDVAYKLSRVVGSPTSAYSYGWIQYDMGQNQPNPEATKIIGDAISNITDTKFNEIKAKNGLSGTRQEIEQKIKEGLKTKGSKNALVEQYEDAINAQLNALSDRIDDATAWSILIALAKTIYNSKQQNVTPVDFKTLRRTT